MRFIGWLCSVAAVAMYGTAARADEVDALASKFGARESLVSASISPDGDKIVYIGTRRDGGENAIVVDLVTKNAVPIFSSMGHDEQLVSCQFILETRVICTSRYYAKNGSDVAVATRLSTIAADGSDMKLLSAPANSEALYKSDFGGAILDYNVPGDPNAVLIADWVVPEFSTASIMAKRDEGLAVSAVNVFSTRRKLIERARKTARGYITDGLGHVRIMRTTPTNESGYTLGVINHSYRREIGGDWESLSTLTPDESGSGLYSGFNPSAVDPVRNVAYGFEGVAGGFSALFERALDGSGTSKLLLAKPGISVDGLLRIGRQRRVVGATYATERRVVDYFDPELKKLAAGFEKALPGHPGISIIDATADESKLLVIASRDVDPGTLYLFDKKTRQLGEVLPLRKEMVGMKLAEVKPITFPGRDGVMIPGYLTLPPGSDGKNLPAIVMPHGGPAARDEWGFDYLSQFFAARGFAVLQPNYRGSTGYGAEWFRGNGFQSWPQAMRDIIDAGKWMEAQGITTPNKLAIFGWSYGGYAALQTSVLEPGVFKAIVAVAPVTDLEMAKSEGRFSSERRTLEKYIGTGPQVQSGSPARYAERITAPVLLFHGDMDRNVGVAQGRLMASRLKAAGKSVEYVEFPDLDHYLEDAAARKRLLMQSDQFLRKSLGL